MGASLWDQMWLPLLIGVAIQIVVSALCFLRVRLWNCLMKQIKTQTAVEESAHDQPLPDSDAAAHANGVPDLEMGNGYGPAEGGESMTEPGLELGTVNSGEGIDYFSDQEAHTPVIKSAVTTRTAQVTGDAATGSEPLCMRVEMDVPHHSQQEEPMAAEQLQKLKHYKDVLHRMIPYLRVPQDRVPKEFNLEKVDAFEKQIFNIMETFKRRRQGAAQ